MNTLYLIGGPPRTGKSTIMNALVKSNPMAAYSFDAVRNGVRKAIFGEAYVTVKDLHFSGEVTFHRAGEPADATHHKNFSRHLREEPLTWEAIIGIIDLYTRGEESPSLAIEGVGIYPQLVHELAFNNLNIRAVFVGFTDERHSETILRHSHANKDWVYTWLQELGGDETAIRNWIAEGVQRSQKDKELAAKYGYGFFDISSMPFDEYVQAVTNYLLGNEN